MLAVYHTCSLLKEIFTARKLKQYQCLKKKLKFFKSFHECYESLAFVKRPRENSNSYAHKYVRVIKSLRFQIRHILGKQSRMTLKSVADSMRSHNTEENTENTASLMNMDHKAKKSSLSKPLPRGASKSSEDDDTSFSSQGLCFMNSEIGVLSRFKNSKLWFDIYDNDFLYRI